MMTMQTITTSTYYSCASHLKTTQRQGVRRDVHSLRTRQIREQSAVGKLCQSVINEIVTSVSWLLSPQHKMNSMCNTYGHIIREAWGNHKPRCSDCGANITSAEQLRKSTPKADNKSTKNK